MQDGRVWLVQRPGKGMLGGMRALPDDGWSARGNGSGQGPLAGPWTPGGIVSHGFTHFSLALHLALYSGDDWASLPGAGSQGADEWWPLDRLEEEGRVVLRYCDEAGEATPEANPNGAQRNIAGICDETGRVVGLMPHPERLFELSLGGADGRRMIESALLSAIEATA